MCVCVWQKMKILLYLFSILLATTVSIPSTSLDITPEWNSWKTQHGKIYPSLMEEQDRHRIWLSNKEFIEEHNMNADYHGYSLTLNHFGDLVCIHLHTHYTSQKVITYYVRLKY